MDNLIIDALSLAFRAHFANVMLTNNQGELSGCIYGTLNSLRSLKKKYPGFHFTFAWDNEPKRKREIYADYKSSRPPFQLGSQINDLKEILSCLNITQSESPGEEADDVIATLAKEYSGSELVFVYSGDKDLLQLVKNGKVIVIRPKKGEEITYDEEAVEKTYGVTPQDFPCFLSFRGDTVDDIPGVKNLRSKVISHLTNKYKMPRSIYASLEGEKLTDFQRESLKESENQIYINYDLIKLRSDLKISSSVGTSNSTTLQKLLDKYGIKSIPSEGLVRMFENEGGFHFRTSPSIKNHSLFDEGVFAV